ncbi:MAG: DUF2284 domain-containing protein [Clostridia bacterium]|nr:DUF2284 domain-containing protein [Clostridia bacterium]
MCVREILYGLKDEFFQYAEASTDVLKFQKEVADACKMNYCGMYGKTWTCPPAIDDYAKMEKQLKKYKNFFVFTTKHSIEDSFDFEGMVAAKDEHTLVQNRVRAALKGTDHRVFGAGGCTNCEKCTYPDSPCRFPEKAVSSIEACGINVVELSRDVGINYVNGENTVTYFSMVFFNRE